MKKYIVMIEEDTTKGSSAIPVCNKEGKSIFDSLKEAQDTMLEKGLGILKDTYESLEDIDIENLIETIEFLDCDEIVDMDSYIEGFTDAVHDYNISTETFYISDVLFLIYIIVVNE